ncbi:MAG: hypothetical protein R2856_12000 [Caldilineaceae bacterium]
MLVASPSFVFWNRQGIFVTNATLAAAYLALWQGIRWVRTRQDRALIVASLAAGTALYAKLLSIWLVGPLGLMLLIAGLRIRGEDGKKLLSISTALKAGIALLVPLIPLLLFNVQTGGTLQSVGGNLGQSYYGVNNLAVGANLPVRLGQLVESLRGGQFWYLGGLHANVLAPWIWGGLLVGALLTRRGRRLVILPALLMASTVALSLFTVSDLFITHYALLQPVTVAVGGLSLAALFEALRTSTWRRVATPAAVGVLALWLVLDVTATVGYHRELTRSGGLADHADAGYHLAYHLQYNGMETRRLSWIGAWTRRCASSAAGRSAPSRSSATIRPPPPTMPLRRGCAPSSKTVATSTSCAPLNRPCFKGGVRSSSPSAPAWARRRRWWRPCTAGRRASLFEIWRVE